MVSRTDRLDWQTPIADERGFPTPYFIRQWELQFFVNNDAAQALETATEAQETANLAKTTADAAQADATQALSDAADAQATADAAETAAADNASDISDILNISFNAGTGLTASGDLSSGPVSYGLANTAVSAGTYGSGTMVPVFTVDAQGRLTAASQTPVSGGGGSGGAQLVAAIRDDGTIPDTTNAAAKGMIIIPIVDVDLHAIYISGQAENGDDYVGYCCELNGSDVVQSVSATGTFTASFSHTIGYIPTFFGSPVSLTAGTRYFVGVANATDGDSSAFLAIEAPTSSETCYLNGPFRTIDGAYLAAMTPAVSDTISTLSTHICLSLVYEVA